MGKAKSSYSLTGFAQLAGTFAAILVGLFVLKPFNTPENMEKLSAVIGGFSQLMIYLPQIGHLIVFWIVIRFLPKVEWEKTPMSFGRLLIIFSMLYVAGQAFNFLGDGITKMIHTGGTEQLNTVSSLVTSNQLFSFLIPAVIAPITEELMFRKLMIDRLHNYGETAVIIFTALCFGLFHGNLQQAIYATAVGTILGSVYCKTGKVVHTILLHIANNTLSFSLTLILPLLTGKVSGAAFIEGIIAALILAAVVITGIVSLIRMLWKRKDIVLDNSMSDAIPKGAVFQTVYLNPGVILLFAFNIYTVISDLFNLPFFGN